MNICLSWWMVMSRYLTMKCNNKLERLSTGATVNWWNCQPGERHDWCNAVQDIGFNFFRSSLYWLKNIPTERRIYFTGAKSGQNCGNRLEEADKCTLIVWVNTWASDSRKKRVKTQLFHSCVRFRSTRVHKFFTIHNLWYCNALKKGEKLLFLIEIEAEPYWNICFEESWSETWLLGGFHWFHRLSNHSTFLKEVSLEFCGLLLLSMSPFYLFSGDNVDRKSVV